MGRESSNNQTPINHQRRKAPPSLDSPGAFPSGGGFGRVQGGLNTSYYSKEDIASTHNRATMNASFASSTTAAPTIEDSSVNASNAPPTIPLETDYFDDTLPEPCCALKRQWIIPLVLMALTAVLAVVIPVAVILGRDDQSQPYIRHTPAPLPDKPNMTLAELHAIVPGLPEETLQRIVEDPHSPQSLALGWVQNDPYNSTHFTDDRKVQRYAMAVLFYALGGTWWDKMAGWRARLSWLQYHQRNECEWTAHSNYSAPSMCNHEGQLTTLMLSHLYLRGTLPPELSLLSHLQEVDIADCNLGKNLTNLFQNLEQDLSQTFPSLTSLQMKDVELTGSIPSRLTTLSTLTHLNLENNQLTAQIPSELGLLPQLDSLRLSGNALTSTVPSELNQLRFLAVLDNPQLQGPLPQELCPELRYLETDWCESVQACCAS